MTDNLPMIIKYFKLKNKYLSYNISDDIHII